ncbi:MAG: hypothetical protein E6I65_10420 [Chloroflexi bacterium]|nr:MAG: hypothetical protein E6I65_10420 [Chloroflexota bacterium]
MAERFDARLVVVLALLGGVVAIGLAMFVGIAPDLLALVAAPPSILRAALAGGAIVVGGRLLLSAVRRIDASIRRGAEPGGRISDADLGVLVRGVRLVFLAAASFTAAAGWILAEPLPLVIALVIAGVDVVETSFLLLVATSRRPRD